MTAPLLREDTKKPMGETGYRNFEDFIHAISEDLKKRGKLTPEWVAALATYLGIEVLSKDRFKFLKNVVGGGGNWINELQLFAMPGNLDDYLDILESAENEFEEIYNAMVGESNCIKIDDIAFYRMDLVNLVTSVKIST